MSPSSQFAAFVLVGALAALANFLSRFLFGLFMPFGPSIFPAFVVGLATAFFLNRAWVFTERRSTNWKTEAWRFTIVNLAGLVVTFAVSILCFEATKLLAEPGPAAEGVAHFFGLGSTAVFSFGAHRLWTFSG
ncbi:MAG: GtrA family protein [Deltaproteobacteria bacterium]|nr:MAG: GtrA family protein [Deltaproteobacteria bacterium]